MCTKVLGGLVAMLLVGGVSSGAADESRTVPTFGLPVNVEQGEPPGLVAYAKSVLTAPWTDGFVFAPQSGGGEPRTVTNCSMLLSDDVSLDDVTPIHDWNTIQNRDRRCRAASLVADSTEATTTDFPERILTAASIQLLPAEVMTRISRAHEETFVAYVAEGKSRWFQHEQIEFVESDGDGRAEFVTDVGMRYWLSVLARTDVTGDGREGVVLLVAASPDGGSLRSHRLLVLEARDRAWWTAQEWGSR